MRPRTSASLFIAGCLLRCIQLWIGFSPFDVLSEGEAPSTTPAADPLQTPLLKVLREKVRIFCWIASDPQNLKRADRVEAVNSTWAPHCNEFVFFHAPDTLNVSNLDVDGTVEQGRKWLWRKTHLAFETIYEMHGQDFDWFVKADDDAFLIIENMRALLKSHKPSDPIYIGCKFKKGVKQGYMSGGASYVLSREALARFYKARNTAACSLNQVRPEDLIMGICMKSVNVDAGDSRDKNKKHTMLPLSLLTHLITYRPPPWFRKYMYYHYNRTDCCSDYLISAHYTYPSTMRSVYYFVYNISIFGVTDSRQPEE